MRPAPAEKDEQLRASSFLVLLVSVAVTGGARARVRERSDRERKILVYKLDLLNGKFSLTDCLNTSLSFLHRVGRVHMQHVQSSAGVYLKSREYNTNPARARRGIARAGARARDATRGRAGDHAACMTTGGAHIYAAGARERCVRGGIDTIMMQMRLACLLMATGHSALVDATAASSWEAVLQSRVDRHVDRTARGGDTAGGAPQPSFGRAASAAPGGTGFWSVTTFGATPDNKTDNTGAFTKALAACGNAGGGNVNVPPGLYRFTGNLTIPQGCTLSGSYKKVPSHSPPCPGCFPVFAGSVLLPTGGRGDGSCSVPLQSPNGGVPCKTAFITLLVDSDLRGFVVYYPEQNHQTTPVPYPWTIFMSGTNSAVQDLECLNCWDAVAAVNAGRHYIARVQGQPLNIGVFVDQTYDIGRIEDVHFNPWWSAEQPMIFWQTTHGRAFVFGRSDWEYVLNTFAFGYAIGYHFIECEDNNGGPGNMNGNFLG